MSFICFSNFLRSDKVFIAGGNSSSLILLELLLLLLVILLLLWLRLSPSLFLRRDLEDLEGFVSFMLEGEEEDDVDDDEDGEEVMST